MAGFQSSLALGAALNIASSAAFLYVAVQLAGRRVPEASRGAMRGFAVFWASIALYNGITALLDLVAATGATPLPLWIVARYVSLVASCVGFAGFLYYTTFVYSGRAWTLAPIAVAYGAFAVFLIGFVTLRGPIGVDVRAWRTDVLYERALEGPIFSIVLATVILPPTIAALAYARLYSRVEDPAQRKRVALVGLALVTWFLSAYVARASESDAWQLVTRPVAGALVAALVLAAHAPGAKRAGAGAATAPRSSGLETRAQELV